MIIGMVTVRIDDHLRVRKADLPRGHEVAIKQRLTIPNGARIAAIKRKQWGARDLPESILLYSDDGPKLVMPRGFAFELRVGLEASGYELKWDDQTSAPSLPLLELVSQGPTLRPDQERACSAILNHRQGVLQAPTGCLAADTVLNLNRAGKGFQARIDKAHQKFNDVGSTMGPRWDPNIATSIARAEGEVSRLGIAENIWASGVKRTYALMTETGRVIRATAEHPFLVGQDAWALLGELREGNLVRVNIGRSNRPRKPKPQYRYTIVRYHPFQTSAGQDGFKVPVHRAIIEAEINGLSLAEFVEILRRDPITAAGLRYLGREWHVHHRDRNSLNNERSNLELLTETEHLRRHAAEGMGDHVLWQIGAERIASIKEYGEEETYDVGVSDDPHNFLANGFVVHNSGKTVVVLEAWRRSGVPGLILVEKAGLAKQWRERAREHLGIETGMIGEGEWDERPLTIAMMQTLHRREISELWWRRRGFTAADESHHLVAESYSDVVSNVTSRWFVGVTATPLEGEWTQPLLTRSLGPIIHITSDDELRKQGLKVTPLIKRVQTGWRWVPQSARDEQLVDTKVIYRRVINALKEDRGRASKIVETIMAQPVGCAQLVTADQLDYLDLIEAGLVMAGYEGDIYMMRGSESGDKRTEIADRADAGRCVILATVADEGTDIPRLDRLHLAWPGRLERKLTQKIGRVLRTHPDKHETIVFDYVDDEGMLVSQSQSRMRVYRKAGYPIETERAMQGDLT
jgi:superfamily II DNA or RNA helicase